MGQIPAHWKVAPVYARYQVQLGKMLDQKQITGEHLRPYLRNIDVQWDQINTIDLPEMDFPPSSRARFVLQPGDLLVCEGGEPGRTAIWQGDLEECYYQKALHRLRPHRKSDLPRFLYYVVRSAARQGVFVATGNPNTIDHLTAEKLRKHRFAFPPIEEQHTIADYLDRETAKIDALIAEIETGIAHLEEYRTALISAAVTGKIDVRDALPSSTPARPRLTGP
jgi:type I restriction enzyme S subunit